MNKICLKCDCTNEENAEFCIECGNSLKSYAYYEPVRICPNCGHANPPSSSVCQHDDIDNCGNLVSYEPITWVRRTYNPNDSTFWRICWGICCLGVVLLFFIILIGSL